MLRPGDEKLEIPGTALGFSQPSRFVSACAALSMARTKHSKPAGRRFVTLSGTRQVGIGAFCRGYAGPYTVPKAGLRWFWELSVSLSVCEGDGGFEFAEVLCSG